MNNNKSANSLGELLKNSRQKSLRKVGGKDFTPQTLSNYERGATLPPKELLPSLARHYEIPVDKLESAYLSSMVRQLKGQLLIQPFLSALDTLVEGDHVIASTQQSITLDEPIFMKKILGLLSKGINFTYLAHIPTDKTQLDQESPWTTNHHTIARILVSARNISQEKNTKGKMSYFIIGYPDKVDFAYLRPFGALLYFDRQEDITHRTPELWSELRSANGEYSWQECEPSFLTQTRYWLTGRCDLPPSASNFNQAKIPEANKRKIKIFSLDEFANKR